ncbi:MAG: dihydrofolate reductase [Bacteroidota bacterium]|nr:dihydrofolate reductase [Bacteroidota bacterium]
MKLSIIAAVAKNGVIGKNNDLIWHLSEDLKRFKKLTTNHTIIMGRKTFESFPVKPLPNRKNVVISKQIHRNYDGCTVAHSIDEALRLSQNDGEVFVCGGAQIYSLLLDKAQNMYITEIDQAFEGDTYFPEFNRSEWEISEKSELKKDAKNGIEYSFVNYKRVQFKKL